MLSNEKILSVVKDKLTEAGLPADEVVQQLHFGKDFSEPGIYVYSDNEKYYITEVGFRGPEEGEHFYSNENELILVIIWNCVVTYIYKNKRFKPNAQQTAFDYLKKINAEYYEKMK